MYSARPVQVGEKGTMSGPNPEILGQKASLGISTPALFFFNLLTQPDMFADNAALLIPPAPWVFRLVNDRIIIIILGCQRFTFPQRPVLLRRPFATFYLLCASVR